MVVSLNVAVFGCVHSECFGLEFCGGLACVDFCFVWL